MNTTDNTDYTDGIAGVPATELDVSLSVISVQSVVEEKRIGVLATKNAKSTETNQGVPNIATASWSAVPLHRFPSRAAACHVTDRLDLPSRHRNKATQQRRTPKPGGLRDRYDVFDGQNWQTMDLEDNTCEAVDLTTDTPQYFYRAVEAATVTE